MKRTLIAAVSLAMLATACGGDNAGTTSTPDESAPSTTTGTGDPQAPLLVVAEEGGFAPIEFVLNRPPVFVLLADGTLIFQGPQPGAFPGPVMPGMMQTQLTGSQLEDINVLIEAAGLPDITELTNNDASNFVADATSTVVTYYDENDGRHVFSVYALGLLDNMPDDIANLLLLRTRLDEFAAAGSAGVPYQSDRLIVRLLEGGSFGAEFDDRRDWAFTFETDPQPVQMPDVPCWVLEGDAAAEVRTLLSDATQTTQWEHANGSFAVLARDVLPGEEGCPAP